MRPPTDKLGSQQPGVSAVVKLSASSHRDKATQHGKDVSLILATIRSSLDNLSDDVNVRALEIEALFEQTKEKDATISKLKKENAKLKQDVAQQAGKVKAFEEWKNLMKSTLDLEASGIK